MATIKVIDIIRRAGLILNDVGATRWSRIELQDWLNDAYREIVKAKPESNSHTSTVTLAPGVSQKIADATSINLPDAIQVLDVTRNMAASSKKRAVSMSSRKMLDDMIPEWSAAAPSVNIEYWIPDPLTPKEFMVYPPAPASPPAQVEVVYSVIPAQHALSDADLNPTGSNTTVISLDDIYANPILDWLLYRAFLKDADSAAMGQRAMVHLSAFASSLGQGQPPQ